MNSMSEALAEAEWVVSWLGFAKDINYELRSLSSHNRGIRVTTIMRDPESELKQLLAVTDAKSMYDNLTREQFTGADKNGCFGNMRHPGLLGLLGWAMQMGTSRPKPSGLYDQYKRKCQTYVGGVSNGEVPNG